MRTIYELEEEDIVKIVADKFNVEPERIDVSYGTKTTNMGTIEKRNLNRLLPKKRKHKNILIARCVLPTIPVLVLIMRKNCYA